MAKVKTNGKDLNVCLRCGQIGSHSTADCRYQIPSIESLEQQMNARLDFALSQVPPEWKSDEYGFYLPSVNRPPIPEGQPNCANCGEFGHTTDECKKPNRDKINFLFGSSLSNTGAAAQEEREEVISKLKRMYYS